RDPGIFFDWNRGRAGFHHLFGAVEELGNVQSHNRARDDAEVRKRRIAAPYAGNAVKDMAELVGCGFGFKLGARIGDSYESATYLLSANCFLDPLEEILLEDVRFQGRTRFTGDDKNSFSQINFILE